MLVLLFHASWFQTYYKTQQHFTNLWARLSGGIHITLGKARIIYEVFVLNDWEKNQALFTVTYIKETIKPELYSIHYRKIKAYQSND